MAHDDAELPSRREADQALADIQQGVADLQGQHATLHQAHGELAQEHAATRNDVVRLNFAVFGIPDTDEKGLLGEVRDIVKKLDHLLLVGIGLIISALSIAVAIATS